MDSRVASEFGGKIRIRVCGVCFKGGQVLLLNHPGLYGHDFWAPPGGGVAFGESLADALKREFLEECKTEIRVGKFLFACEFIRPPLHALELFFEVENFSNPILGSDPEMTGHQVISELRFFDFQELKNVPLNHLHGLFRKIEKLDDLRLLTGIFRIA